LNHYFYQKYVGPGRSIFNEIKKLEESHYILFDINDKQLKINQYYNLEEEIEKVLSLSDKEKKKRISELIPDAVEKRLISDVPVGSFLSGGLDSSLISSIIAEKHPKFDVFSIGFTEQTFNELDYAKLVAEKIGVIHHYQILPIDENLIFEVIGNIDEPFGDSSLIPTNLLSKITRKKVTVSLSGDAGDELFGGYDTYLAYKLARFVPNFLIRFLKKLTHLFPASDKNHHITFKIIKFINDWDNDIQIRHLNWMSQTNEIQRKKLLGDLFKTNTDIIHLAKGTKLRLIQLNDFHNYLSNDILRKVDMASMAHSLEARVPFLDYRIVALALSLKENNKIRRFITKYFLKQFARYFIPKQIIQRKKKGFAVPLSHWFKQSVKMKEIISDKKYFKHQFLNYEYVQILLAEHIKGKQDNSRVLWLIFVFNLWYSKQNISNP
jgi:asparagine synthase (glutamine-hydrolysing)